MAKKLAARAGNEAQPGSSRDWRPWLLGSVAALLLARPLVAGDSAALMGEGGLLVLLWLGLVAAWLASMVARGTFALRFVAADAAVTALAAAHILSGLVTLQHGNPRPAINMAWEWVAALLSYLLLRQLISDRAQVRAMIVAMVAMAAAQATLGYYQKLVVLPETQAHYERIKDDPVQMMRETGHYAPPGSPERKRFEDRLQSAEPTGRFALANSLAGFLAPWLVVAAGIGATFRGRRAGALLAWMVLGGLILWIGGCLLLTGSRTAGLATLAGLVVVFPAVHGRRPGTSLRSLIWLAVVVAAILLMAALVGVIAPEQWAGAWRSLSYRFEYWRAALAMVGDYPLLGSGPGQFQDTYTAYKLPHASEEVQDPHNFLLEVWATAGTVGMVALLLVLTEFARRVYQFGHRWQLPDVRGEQAAVGAFRPIGGGLLAAPLLALVVGESTGSPLSFTALALLLVSVLASSAVLYPWVLYGNFPPRLAAVGMFALLLNLCVAGAVGYPGVMVSFWVLLAVALTVTDGRKAVRTYSSHLAIIGAAAALLLAVICYVTLYLPVLQREGYTARALQAQQQGNIILAEQHLTSAAKSDPYSGLAARRLAEFRFQLWQENPSLESQWQQATERMLTLNPRSEAAWQSAGRWALTAYEQTGEREHLEAAVARLEKAVSLYPHQASSRAWYALARAAAGESEKALAQAELALELDEIVAAAGHEDRRLEGELRRKMLRITDNHGIE